MLNATRTGRARIAAFELWHAVLEHDVAGLAAQLSYRFALALLWLLIFSTALSGLFAESLGGANPTERIMESLFARSPGNVQPILEAQLQQLIGAHSPALLASSAFGALWTGTAGFTAVMNALNRVYAVDEERPYLSRVLLGAELTSSVGALLFLISVLLLVRQTGGEEIATALELSPGTRRAVDVLGLALAITALIGATEVLYRVTPNRDSRIRWRSAGALLFVVVWLGATFLFGAYLANFPSYANAYGVIGTLLVLFTWFFITAFALLLGAELDALIERGGSRR